MNKCFRVSRLIVTAFFSCLLMAGVALSQFSDGKVAAYQKISSTEGNFTGGLSNGDRFRVVAGLGDMDGDGVEDLAVGATQDDDGGTDHGAVWILFLNPDGTVKSHQKISDTEGNFTGVLSNSDFFGVSVVRLGDLDNDGIEDLAVGATGDDDGGTDRGAVWILLMNNDGTVKSNQKISQTQGGFTDVISNSANFGQSVTGLGDLDGDGVEDLAVGTYLADDGGTNNGAVWILFLNSNGTVKANQKISKTQGNFTGTLDNFDQFGIAVAALGDLDGDAIMDLAVGANGDDDGGADFRGAVWVLFMNSNGTVKSHQKISDTQGNFSGILNSNDVFGASIVGVGDLDGDGVEDMAVGAPFDDDGGTDRGAAWVLFLNSNGTVKSYQKISDTEGDFTGTLDNSDHFSYNITNLGDLNGDGITDLAVGSRLDDDGGADRGAAWILFMHSKVLAHAGTDQGICPGGSAILGATPAATEGTAPYSFNWTALPADPSLTSPTDENPTVSPTVTTTYTLTVTDANSFMHADEITVTVNPLPTATVSGDASICAGGSATISAALTGTGPWNITWSDAVTQNGITSSPATRIVNPATTMIYMVTSVSDANCTGTSSGSATITINPSPTATVSGNAAICAGSLATISAALTGTPPWSITWSDGASQSGINTSPATRTVNPTETTTYTVTSVSDANCTGTSSGSATVTINPSPTATVSGSTTICAGGSATITAVLTGTAPWNLTWSDGFTQPASSSPATRVVSPASTTTYTVNAVSDANCTGTSSGSAMVAVNPLPTVTVSGDATICAGSSTTLTATLTGIGPWNLAWSDGFVQNDVASSPATRDVSPATTTTYTVTSVSDANCTGTSSGSATITINPSPTATVSGNAAICAGSPSTIAAALTGTPPWSITWSDGASQSGINTSPATRTVSPTETTMYTVTSVSDANCTGTSSGSATVTINPSPTATVSGSTTICAGGSATITAVLTGTAPWNLTWSDGLTQPASSSPATRVVSPASTTTYTVNAVSDANCTGTSSGSATVTINPLSTATVSGDATICAGRSTTLTAALTGTGPWNLTWSDGATQNGITNSPVTRSVSPTATTVYTVTTISDANCTGTALGSATVTVRASNPPVIGAVIVPVNPTLINTAINASADFTADCDNDDHSATWDWGDNTNSAGTINQSDNGVTGSHTYIAAGVYTVTLTVTDGAGNSGEGTATAFVVIYDPNAGFVTGGGWIMSPAGAYVADPTLTGKANFGFVSKYQKGKTIPDGNTEFNFKAGSLNFHSTVYEWLVIAGPNAKYKGSGTINNSGNYGFMLTARDGQISGGGGIDKFRIKIWDKNNNDAVVYDNQMNAPDDAEATDAIEGGSITIHKNGASKEAVDAAETVPVSFGLEQNHPNPFNPSTTISFALPEAGNVMVAIYSSTGQLVRELVHNEMPVGRHAISWDGRNQSGEGVATGMYLYRLVVRKPSGETAFTETKRMLFVQ